MIRFRVNGRPAPQGSKRHVGHGIMVESSKAVKPWREAIRAECQRAVEADRAGALSLWPPGYSAAVTAIFLLPRPKSHYRSGRCAGQLRLAAPPRPGQRPDLDKLARALLDGLVMGGAMADDSQIVDLNVSKMWCGPTDVPGVIVEIGEAK